MTEVREDPTVQRRRLRAELRGARDAAGLRQAEVADAMDWSLSKLMRIERGEVNVSTNDLRALLNHYGVKDKGKVNGLLELARSARGSSFYDQYVDLLKPGFREYLAYEASASVIRQYEPVLLPGLLQTEEYARGLFEGMSRVTSERADRGWTVRQHRQELVDRESPPEMRYVLDEAALRRHVGRGHAMRRQLERIKELGAEPNINIQVMPFDRGAHPGMAGSFVLLEFADPNLADLLHLESIDSMTVRDDTYLIARYLDRFAELERLALSPDESVDFLDVLIGEMSLIDQPANSAHKETV
ncbi:MAG: helix-turn-helix domain-containing protein [Pseudonocardiales bacterium]|nr:helix-turn-helix domain-containing protein [Pseudonocardiales bacterium]MBV9729847.1 helix-turn-helix domain-containing protein [Pseudonocardiales bacterium]